MVRPYCGEVSEKGRDCSPVQFLKSDNFWDGEGVTVNASESTVSRGVVKRDV